MDKRFAKEVIDAVPGPVIEAIGPYLKAVVGLIAAGITLLVNLNQAVEALAIVAAVYAVPNIMPVFPGQNDAPDDAES